MYEWQDFWENGGGGCAQMYPVFGAFACLARLHGLNKCIAGGNLTAC